MISWLLVPHFETIWGTRSSALGSQRQTQQRRPPRRRGSSLMASRRESKERHLAERNEICLSFFKKFPVADFFLFWDRKKMNPEKSGQWLTGPRLLLEEQVKPSQAKSSQVKPTSHEPATVRMAINCRRPNFYDSRFHEFLNGPFMTIGQFIIRTRTGPRRSIFFRKVVNSITMEASFRRRWSTDQLRLDRNCKSRSAWLFLFITRKAIGGGHILERQRCPLEFFFRFYLHKCDFL